MIRSALLASIVAIVTVPLPALGQESDQTFGGAKGADLSIEAMEPDGSAITIRPAGKYPADIARCLLAHDRPVPQA